MRNKWQHKIMVKGTLPFPIDMLRYDRCTPFSEPDSHEIERSISRQGEVETYEVTVQHVHETKDWEPTFGRWRSFGWAVQTHDATRI